MAELAKLDLDIYTPGGAIEALAPKGRYSFRIAHQSSALDTLLLLACVVELGEQIEAKRQSTRSIRAFSYRFSTDLDSGQIFRTDRTYKAWLNQQVRLIVRDKTIKRIVITDISDYYARINFHRLENLIDEVAPSSGAARFIKKTIKIIRARQSFGLPVGGSAARLLAELALCDTDQALRDRDLLFTRFVDDFRIFVRGSDEPYDALAYLAEQLGINEGLALNPAKTGVLTRQDYLRRLKFLTSDLEEQAEGVALDELTRDLYFDEEPDEDDLERLKGLKLVEMLENEIDDDDWDIGRVRVLFRALRIAKPSDAVAFVKKRFDELAIFAKEMCLLMEALAEEFPGCFNDMTDQVIEAISTSPASSVQLIRTWLLEIFVRGIIVVQRPQIKELEALPAAIDKRQILLIRGRCDDKNYFRRQKTAIQNFSDVELPSLIWGASCLPSDEFEIWVDTAKASFIRPLGSSFLKWIVRNRSTLISKLKSPVLDHLE